MDNKEFASTVVSIVPFDIVENKPALYPARYFIKASDGIEVEVLHVDQGHHFVYLDESRESLRVNTPSNEIARSIVDDFMSGQLRTTGTCRPGLFWLPGYLTVEDVKSFHNEKLMRAKMYQQSWLRAIVNLADDDWKKFHQHTVISDFQRIAGAILKLRPEEHEWLGTRGEDTSGTCPACGLLHQKNIAVCPGCRCVLDKAKYESLVFA